MSSGKGATYLTFNPSMNLDMSAEPGAANGLTLSVLSLLAFLTYINENTDVQSKFDIALRFWNYLIDVSMHWAQTATDTQH